MRLTHITLDRARARIILYPSSIPETIESFCPIVPFEKVSHIEAMSITCKLTKLKHIS